MTRYGSIAVVLGATTVLMFGCAKQPATMATAAPAPTGASGVSPMSSASTSPQPTASQGTGSLAGATRSDASDARPAPTEFAAVRDLVDVHFDFDKYAIGHCDERGTEEYNLSLGDRRAKAAVDYLVAQGIPAARMVTISYGKERPQCSDRNEACWAKNRRAHFLVKRG